MSVSRLLFFCSIGLATAHIPVQRTIAARDSEKVSRNAPAESSITFSSVHVDGPYIAITFDDGPSATLTPKLLDILAAHHIKTTFFVIGENVVEHPEIVARAAREGHEIGNHSWSHPNFGKMSDEGVRGQVQRTDDAIKRLLARDRFGCDHLMDPLRRAKNVGFTISSDIKSFFETSIRTIGSDPGRPQCVIAFSKKRSLAQSCCPTTFIRGRLKRCRQLSMH